MPRYIDPDTGAELEYCPPLEGTSPLSLSQVFKWAPERTLKLQLKEGASLTEAVRASYAYVRKPFSTHNRIEFKFDNCYIVVAKLKEGA